MHKLKILVITITSVLLTYASIAADTIKVGVLHSLSGTMAISESTLKDTILMMIDEQNKKGGLLGKKLESETQDLDINEHFFGGDKLELKDLDKILRSYENITLVGNEIIDEAIKLGFIKKDNVGILKIFNY